jgi:hypothetical protein
MQPAIAPVQKDVCGLQIQPQQHPVKQIGEAALKKTETDLALERLLAERKKLDNFWSQ